MSISITPENKTVVTLKLEFRHGKAPTMGELANLTFSDAIFPDGTALKDLTFAELLDQVWTYENKNNTSLSYENKN